MNPYNPSPNQIPPNENNPPQNLEMGMIQPQMIYVPQNNNYQQPQYGYAQPGYPQYNATQTTYIQMQQPTYVQANQNAMAPYGQPQQMPNPQYPAHNGGNDDQPPQVNQKSHEKKSKNPGPKRYRTYRAPERDIEDEVEFWSYVYLWICCRTNNNSCSRSPCCICCCDSTNHQSAGDTCCCNASCCECDGDCCKLDCCELKGCCCKIDWCDALECCDLKDCCDFKCDCFDCDCDICGDDD